MKKIIKHEFYYKLSGTIIYFILSLPGLSILFLFPVRKLLLDENSKEFQITKYLLNDFSKIIHENINTSLIKNILVTGENEECPENFTMLSIKNEYYGNFTKFFGKKSICIERMNNSKYSYRNILKQLEANNNEGKKLCGELSKDSNRNLYVDHDESCPLTNISFFSEKEAINLKCQYHLIESSINNKVALCPIFGQKDSFTSIAIININIINNIRQCVENPFSINSRSCEFHDNNECFFEDNFIEIPLLVINNNFYPNYLSQWNLANDNNIEHDFCNKEFVFHIFVSGYVNFTSKNWDEFEEEFPSDNLENNALHKAVSIFNKYSKNIDRVFYLLSCILFCFSLIQFFLQILLYYTEIRVSIIYIIYGSILLVLKILSYFGMTINHYLFYLKIEKVYVVLVDIYKNQILELYSSIRNRFIVNIIIFSIVGLFIICADFIIYFFNITLDWEGFFTTVKKGKNKPPIINEKDIIDNLSKKKDKRIGKADSLKNLNEYQLSENEVPNNEDTNKQYHDNFIDMLKNESKKYSENKLTNDFDNKSKKDYVIKTLKNPYKQSNNDSNIQNDNIVNSIENISNSFSNAKKISLKFVFKNELQKSYEIKILNNKTFEDATEKLKKVYPELKDKKMRVFQYDSQIINKNKTLKDNGIIEDTRIIILP
jgi:hypothetical protein